MGIKSQRKGREAERELCRILQEYGIPAKPGDPLNFGTVPDVVGIPGIHAEVKRQERLNLTAAIDQAVRDSQKFNDGLPAVFHRRNRQEWLVTMKLCDWIQIFRKD